jgi:hypothetical protein
MTGDIELGRTNAIAPQKTENGAVIEINDNMKEEIEEIHENGGNVRKGQDSSEEVTDSMTHENDDDEDDDENSPLGLCRFIVKHHRLAFGMFAVFQITVY